MIKNRGDEWIEHLRLQPHPEGGWFRETYRSDELFAGEALPARFGSSRCFATAIYFLLTTANFSSLHRIKSDEQWYFHHGACLTIHVISPDGVYRSIRLGAELSETCTLQAVVPAGSWFGASVEQPDSYALVSCSVSPGFEFTDFEIADRVTLLGLYPQHQRLIESLTR